MKLFFFALIFTSLVPWNAISATKLQCKAEITIIDGTTPIGVSGTSEILEIPISHGQGQGLAMLGKMDNAVLITYNENVFGGSLVKSPKVCISRQDSGLLESCIVLYTTDASSLNTFNLYLNSERVDKKSVFVSCDFM